MLYDEVFARPIPFLLIGIAICALVFAVERSNTPNAAWYAAAEGADPIFAIEGTDPAKLSAAVEAFLQQRNTFAVPFGPRNGHVIDTSLYPETFLKLLPRLEAQRQELLVSPTTENAISYHQLLIKTIDAYEDGAKNLANVLNAQQNTGVSFLGEKPRPVTSPHKYKRQFPRQRRRKKKRTDDSRVCEASTLQHANR